MFNNHKKDSRAPEAAAPITASDEPVHQFDQTNGVMKDYDTSESPKHGEDGTLVDFDSDEQKRKQFSVGSAGVMMGGGFSGH